MYAIYSDGELLYSPHMIDEGYGVLQPKLTLELNKAGSLEFTLPPNNVLFDSIQKLKSIITVEQDGTEIFRGRVLHDEKDFYNRKSIYCEGELSFLIDSVIRPYSYQGNIGQYFRKLVTEHNSQVDPEKQFIVGNVTVTDPNDYITRGNINYPTTFDELQSKLVGNLGGYLKTRKSGQLRFLDYLTDAGGVSDQVIQFGVNMLDISEYINAENVFTVLVPLGKKEETEDGSEGSRLTIESVNGGKDYIEDQTAISIFGRITRTETWDDVTVASNLLTKGREFLNQGIEMSVTLSIKAVDLYLLDVKTERIKLGDFVRVLSVPHGLDKYFLCSKMVIDMISPDKTEFTLGVGFTAMTDTQIKSAKQANTAYQTAESASNTASNTSSLVSGNSNQYVAKTDFVSYQNQITNNFNTVNAKLSSVFHYKGSVDSFSDLPSANNVIGDTYNINSNGANYVWTGKDWDKLSENAVTVDIPEKLPNPSKLKFTGAVVAEYDGSEEIVVDIPKTSSNSGSTSVIYDETTESLQIVSNSLIYDEETESLMIGG